ncbi:hypothetical protein [Halobacteriovorax sp. RT-2-5]|uniref:hypothetical protein n=1 Tax=unclassified Halobacteriovorax TaxID=2639665 RepID=UPI00399BA4B5
MNYLITFLIWLSVIEILKQRNKNCKIQPDLNKILLTKKEFWESSPRKKTIYRFLYFIFLLFFTFPMLGAFSQRFELVFFSLPIIITLIFILIIFFKCPNCKKSIFLQDLSTLSTKFSKVCFNCGHPESLPKNIEPQVIVRPFIKWLFYIFIAFPLTVMTPIIIYYGITEYFSKYME